jgi:hypothetical protein
MTLDEARSHIGSGVLYCTAADEAQHAVIARVLGSWVFVRCSSDDRTKPATPEDLTLLAGRGTEAGETLTAGDLLAASQASLNEIVAAIIRDGPAGRWQAGNALNALRYHNWASGFTFEGEPASDAPWDRPLQDAAVRKTRGLEAGKRYRAKLAQAEADALKHGLPYGAAPVKRRGFRADETALVYLVTHAGYRAAKVGIADTAGSRLAEHRRGGWQILAVFQVTAKAAIAIETDILRWWRGELGLPSYLSRGQMPQGGWTETVAAAGIDLAATVAHVCELALRPEARPAALASGARSPGIPPPVRHAVPPGVKLPELDPWGAREFLILLLR